MTVARNESTRLGRKRSSRPELDEPSPEIPDMAQRELHQFLRQQIHALDTPHRDVLLLHYFSGLKVREIAVLLQISKAAAGKRLERARATLGEQVIAQLRTGLENERPNRKGENRVMAAVAVIPIPP